MARKEKKYHYIYKTTNLKTGKFYVGMHSTDNLNDGYLGSGKRLRRSIRKNGIENFKLEILEFLSDRSSLKAREKELVNEDLLKDPMCMNLQIGGGGGFHNQNHRNNFFKAAALKDKTKNIKAAICLHDRRKSDDAFDKRWKKIISDSLIGRKTWLGKKHSEECKRKIGDANRNKIGEKNSQYGTVWITNGTENKKIKKEENIPDGWYKGRK
jgi:hypothetical protein